MSVEPLRVARAPKLDRPRLGFLGAGWIGRHRLEAVAASGLADIVVVADTVPERARDATAGIRGAHVAEGLGALLAHGLDGVVIATPSALHTAQCCDALAHGCAVFCQKPLARTAREARTIVDAARDANRLLGVDLCYRTLAGVNAMRDLVRSGELGHVYAIDAVFHNAYGPDKPWLHDPVLAGGGCVIDLGIHLVDLALWLLDFPAVVAMSSRLFAAGEPLGGRRDVVEDHAIAEIVMEGGAAMRLACSWHLHAGRDAEIGLAVYGTAGGVALHNVDGSSYDFTVERFRGASRDVLAAPPDAWGGRAILDWTRRLAAGERFAPDAERMVEMAAVLDGIYFADGAAGVMP